MALPISGRTQERTRVSNRRVPDPGREMNRGDAGRGFGAIASAFNSFSGKLTQMDEEAEVLKDQEALAQFTLDVADNPSDAAAAERSGDWSGWSIENRLGRADILKAVPLITGQALGASAVSDFQTHMGTLPATADVVKARDEWVKNETKGMSPSGAVKFRETFYKGTAKPIQAHQKALAKAVTARNYDNVRNSLTSEILSGTATAESIAALKSALSAGQLGKSRAEASFEASEFVNAELIKNTMHPNPAVAALAMRLASTHRDPLTGLTALESFSRDEINDIRKKAKDAWAHQVTQADETAARTVQLAILGNKTGEVSNAELQDAFTTYMAHANATGLINTALHIKTAEDIADAMGDGAVATRVVNDAIYGNAPSEPLSDKDLDAGFTLVREDPNSYIRLASMRGSTSNEKKHLSAQFTTRDPKAAFQASKVVEGILAAKGQGIHNFAPSEFLTDYAYMLYMYTKGLDEETFGVKYEEGLEKLRGVTFSTSKLEEALSSVTGLGSIIGGGTLTGVSGLYKLLDNHSEKFTAAIGLGADEVDMSRWSPEAAQRIRHLANLAANFAGDTEFGDGENLVKLMADMGAGEFQVKPGTDGKPQMTTYTGPKKVIYNGTIQKVTPFGTKHAKAFTNVTGNMFSYGAVDSNGWATVTANGGGTVVPAEGGNVHSDLASMFPESWVSDNDDGTSRIDPPSVNDQVIPGGRDWILSPGKVSFRLRFDKGSVHLEHAPRHVLAEAAAGGTLYSYVQALGKLIGGNNDSIVETLKGLGGPEGLFGAIQLSNKYLTMTDEEVDDAALRAGPGKAEAELEQARRGEGGTQVTLDNASSYLKEQEQAVRKGEKVYPGMGKYIAPGARVMTPGRLREMRINTQQVIGKLVALGQLPASAIRVTSNEHDVGTALIKAREHAASKNWRSGDEPGMAKDLVTSTLPFKSTYEKPTPVSKTGRVEGLPASDYIKPSTLPQPRASMTGAIEGIEPSKPEPPKVVGDVTPEVGYGYRVDWPSSVNEMKSLGIDPSKPLTREQAEGLAEVRLASIRSKMNGWFENVPFSDSQYSAMMLAVYTSPWLKSVGKDFDTMDSTEWGVDMSPALKQVVVDRTAEQKQRGNWDFGVGATKNRAPVKFVAFHSTGASSVESSLGYINRFDPSRNFSPGYSAVAGGGKVHLAAPPNARTNGTGHPIMKGQSNSNTFHLALQDEDPETMEAVRMFVQEVLINQMGVDPNNLGGHGTASNRRNAEGVGAAAKIQDVVTARVAKPHPEGRPEVITDKLLEAAHAKDWKTVAQEIRRATRVTTQGLNDLQKSQAKDAIKFERGAQAQLFLGAK